MVGYISQIWTNVAEIKFTSELEKIQLEQALVMHENRTVLIIKKILNHNTVRAAVIAKAAPIAVGSQVINTLNFLQVPVGPSAKNQVFNILGQSQNTPQYRPRTIPINSIINVGKENFSIRHKLLETGIKALDFFVPIFEGYKIGIFGGAWVGKTVLMKEIIFNVSKQRQKVSSIFVGSGERSREGLELFLELKESNLMAKSTMFVAQMNETPGARSMIVPMGVTAAEYARDYEKEDVLLFIDNIYRFIQATNEVSSALEKNVSIGGYHATMASDVAFIQDRLFKNENGSITSFQTVFLPMDDLSDPAAISLFTHLDSSFVLSRDKMSRNIFPAFDPLVSTSNSVSVNIIGERHFNAIIAAKSIMKKYKDLEDVILILGFDELDAESKIIVRKALQLENFFTQNFFMAAAFTKEPGVYVPLEKTIDSVIRIINGEFLDVSPSEFAFIGSVDDLFKKES